MYRLVYYVVFAMIGSGFYSIFNESLDLKNIFGQTTNGLVSVANAESAKNVDVLNGKVVAVSDGDTLTVSSRYGNVIIRMFAIDAPEATCHGLSDNFCVEKGQAGAKESKLHLRQLVLGKYVDVRLGQGMSGNRVVGTVYADGKDINLAMVDAGHAWHYKYFSKNQSPTERETYTKAEANARHLKAGVWSDDNPLPPWVWRKRNKSTF